MKLGFVSAILPELSLDEVLAFAAEAGLFERRGDVLAARARPIAATRALRTWTSPASTRTRSGASSDLIAKHGVSISGLGYYPNPLSGRPGRGRAWRSSTCAG